MVLLERGRLTNGTTWHAAGLVSQIRGNHALTALTKDNATIYERLPAETGVETGMRRHGAMTIARTAGRLQEALYGVAMAKDFGVDVEVLGRDGIKAYWPAANVDDLHGAVNFPTDGTVNPGDAALSFAKGAVDQGARYVPDTTVTGFVLRTGRVTRVETIARSDRGGDRRPGLRVCGPPSWRGGRARAWRCTRPSTCGS